MRPREAWRHGLAAGLRRLRPRAERPEPVRPRADGRPTWGVVATLSEPPALAYAFAAHYLAAGADRVYLVFDTPDPETAARIARHPRTDVTRRGRGYWRAAGFRSPPGVVARTVLNAREAYDRGEVEWLLSADADEFLIDVPAVLDHLAGVPDEVDAVVMPNSERVYLGAVPEDDIFAGAFRRPGGPVDPEPLRAVHGDDLRFLNGGFAGYRGGKTFSRLGRGLRLRVHRPRPEEASARLPFYPEPVLLHLESATPAHFLGKWRRKAAQQSEAALAGKSPGRRAQLAEIRRLGDDRAAQRAFFDRLKVLDPADAARLEAAGLLWRPAFDPKAAVAELFPDVTLDYSVAAFDAAGLKRLG